MSTSGLHTLLNYSNFYIKRQNLESVYANIRLVTRNILKNNNIRIVDQSGVIFRDNKISPEGWTYAYLLDLSHFSSHAFTDTGRGKMAIDMFTCNTDTKNHLKAVEQVNTFLVENYFCMLNSRQDIPRFISESDLEEHKCYKGACYR